MNGIASYAAVLAALLVLALAVSLVRRRRASRAHPLPAGLRHFAANVGYVSHLGHGLRVDPDARWRRIGALIGVR